MAIPLTELEQAAGALEQPIGEQKITIISRYYGNGDMSIVEIRAFRPFDIQGRIRQSGSYDEYSDIFESQERAEKFQQHLTSFMFKSRLVEEKANKETRKKRGKTEWQ